MKFQDMPYRRPDYEEISVKLNEFVAKFKGAKTAAEAETVHKEYSAYTKRFGTMFSLAKVRNDINTADEYYAGEIAYANDVRPKLQAVEKEFDAAVLASPFRSELEAKWGSLYFRNMEMLQKTFSPEIIAEMQESNRIVTEYQKLTASAKIEFDGKTLNMAQLAAYTMNPDREVRKAAGMARAAWYAGVAEQLDSLTDRIIKVRAKMAGKLGFKSFADMGQFRMKRHFTPEMVNAFRDGVAKYIVPVAAKLKEEQAARIGVKKLEMFDDAFQYPDGNAKPFGTVDEIFAHGRKMYHELSEETGKFIDFMMDSELFDVLARPNKAPGGYCSMFNEYGAPFIFATFTGTSGDISVLTHEAGHALAFYAARDIYPHELQSTFGETAEVHSMSMEFFTWPWLEGFFGDETEKYRESHITKAITSIPFGTMLDEFEYKIYGKPEMTPADRNALWLELEKKYRPWMNCDGVPFYSEGRAWQPVLHIFTVPLYYISYCLAQTVALCFWTEDQKNHEEAWKKYRRFMGFAATKTFEDLIEDAGLPSPFNSETLKYIADSGMKWLEGRK